MLGSAAALVLLALLLARAPLPWIFLAGCAAALLLGALIRPPVALVALAVVIPFARLWPLPLPGANAADALVALALAAWLADRIRRRSFAVRRPAITWPLLAFVWLAALSLTQATSWREGLPEWLKWAEFAVITLLAAQAPGRRWLWATLGALFLAGVAEAALGAYQFWFRAGPEGFLLPGRFMRAYGTFEQPNPYAGYLGYLAPVAASLALGALGQGLATKQGSVAPRGRPGGRKARCYELGAWRMAALGAGCGAVALALAAGIAMSWSRGAWLGLAAALVAVVGLYSRRTAILTAGVGVALVAAVALAGTGWLPERVRDLGSYTSSADPARTEITDANFAVLERLAHWNAGWQMFSDHPWLGVGIGNYGVAYADYAPAHWYEPLGHAHNIYLNTLAETGILGAAGFLAFWLGAIGLAWRSAAQARDDWLRRALALGVLGTLVYLSVHHLFDNLFVQHMQLQLALLLGGLSGLSEKVT